MIVRHNTHVHRRPTGGIQDIDESPDWLRNLPAAQSGENSSLLVILGVLVPLAFVVVTRVGQFLLATGTGGYGVAALVADEIDLDEYERRLEQLFDHHVADATGPVVAEACRYARGEIDAAELAELVATARSTSTERAHRASDEYSRSGDRHRTQSDRPVSADSTEATAPGDAPGAVADAIARLRYRYAEGELTDEEYRRRLAVLRQTERETD